ncbi:MAG TPA: thioredoxin domain-containing protein, partial [Candidatus Competibacteraceae bacterium]|nr:thioredoxin domain-containing protein [Candidatus Competibacteraceae bacterium]
MTEPAHTNRLIHETSPYLRQHAHNPVDWYPWNEEALDKARRENKPILLSIGYSACHWCHVMAHESFEDEATAQVMNELFVNIKVDREERPDLDKIYQTAFQMLHRRAGGWPLTMFLTHDDHIPFVGGTYFPNQPRYGMPAFVDILRRVSDHYHQRPADIRQQNQALLEILHGELAAPSAAGKIELTVAPLQAARDQAVSHFDPTHGGFGGAPKFPHPTSLERLLRHWTASLQRGEPDHQAETAALFTLRKMALGGIYDHLGGGFYRYSVDAEWQIPHFEKMLYDNGPLLALYAQAWRATQDPLFHTVAEETGVWLIREMQSPEGGYYATLDADSEGEEGKFYLWTPEQVREQLTTEEYAVFAVCYGLELPANFEGHAWHLRVAAEPAELARRLNVEPAQVNAWLTAAQRKLFSVRSKRIWPGRDEKILTAWNGLAIRGMAIAGRHLGQPDFVASAERALDFIHNQLWRAGRLQAVYKDGQSRLNAYLDDYAFLIDGILELLQCRWRDGDLDFALALADVLLDRFEDRRNGGFYFTADDHETLIQRPKPPHDDAL